MDCRGVLMGFLWQGGSEVVSVCVREREGGGDARCKNLKFFSFSSSSEKDFVESGRTCCIHTVGFSHLLD